MNWPGAKCVSRTSALIGSVDRRRRGRWTGKGIRRYYVAVASLANLLRRFNFTLLAPFYDGLVSPLEAMRMRSLDLAAVQAGERVLLVGAGTGLDVPLLRPDCRICATDYTLAMLARIPRRSHVSRAQMDAGALAVGTACMDVVVLHLIVSVVPDPLACLQEVRRVLKPDGRVALFDKLKPEGRRPPLLLRLFRPFGLLLGTDVSVDLDTLAAKAGLRIVHREPGMAGGVFQVAKLVAHSSNR